MRWPSCSCSATDTSRASSSSCFPCGSSRSVSTSWSTSWAARLAGQPHPPARRRLPASSAGTSLLLDAHLDAGHVELESHALGGVTQLDLDAVLVRHGDCVAATGKRRPGSHGGVVAVEVLELVQVVDVA